MSDEQFRQLCNTFGFAPSRALREMLDAAARQAVLAEREACAKEFDRRGNGIGFYEPHEPAEIIRARKEKT